MCAQLLFAAPAPAPAFPVHHAREITAPALHLFARISSRAAEAAQLIVTRDLSSLEANSADDPFLSTPRSPSLRSEHQLIVLNG